MILTSLRSEYNGTIHVVPTTFCSFLFYRYIWQLQNAVRPVWPPYPYNGHYKFDRLCTYLIGWTEQSSWWFGDKQKAIIVEKPFFLMLLPKKTSNFHKKCTHRMIGFSEVYDYSVFVLFITVACSETKSERKKVHRKSHWRGNEAECGLLLLSFPVHRAPKFSTRLPPLH